MDIKRSEKNAMKDMIAQIICFLYTSALPWEALYIKIIPRVVRRIIAMSITKSSSFIFPIILQFLYQWFLFQEQATQNSGEKCFLQ